MALTRAREQGLSSFQQVRVRVGAWTGIDPDHLKHDFEDLAPGVDLRIELVVPSAHCEECNAEFRPEPDKPSLACANCGSNRIRLDQSKETELVDIR